MNISLLRTTSRYLKLLEKLGILTVEDLLKYYPRAYEDRSWIRRFEEIDLKETNVVQGKIVSLENVMTKNRRRLVKGVIEESEGMAKEKRQGQTLWEQSGSDPVIIKKEKMTAEMVWFNQPYIARMLAVGEEVLLSGRVKYDYGRFIFQSPTFEKIREEQIHTGRIIPIYHETEGLSSDWLREKIKIIFPLIKKLRDFLPVDLLKEENLIDLQKAVMEIHFPSTREKLEQAKKRLAFEELFLLQLVALQRKKLYQKKAEKLGKAIPFRVELIKNFIQQLPFQLTNAQKITTYQIFKDMEKPYPMLRLLQGEVGSGKTVVAEIVSLHTIYSGYQVAWLAPTETLARQHYEKIKPQMLKLRIKVVLLIGSTGMKEKQEIYAELNQGATHWVIGTHALLEEKVGFKNLGLVMVDEQHRFGVEQRNRLATYGCPHVLQMTATPIPRTLALVLYGDKDLSVIDELPVGRKKIITKVVSPAKRRQAYGFMESEVGKGRQVYVVCPRIEKAEAQNLEQIQDSKRNDWAEVRAAKEEYRKLQEEIFPRLRVGLLHGRMKSKEKEETMHDFRVGKIQILVSTAVIEVGIDVPNATIMLIEGVDRFGLAQLHQFRGRVGRSDLQSYCFLFTDSESGLVRQRLGALEKYSSGFKLAEIDLKLRGPGEVYGTRQSGIPDLKMASLADALMINRARVQAEKILEEDLMLDKYPELKERLGKIK